MSEHTPTTSAVREAYVRQVANPPHGPSRRQAMDQFYRWLAEHERAHEQQIREQVGDEIEAEYGRRSPIHIDAAYQYNSGVLDGLDIAEQIARTRKDT